MTARGCDARASRGGGEGGPHRVRASQAVPMLVALWLRLQGVRAEPEEAEEAVGSHRRRGGK